MKLCAFLMQRPGVDAEPFGVIFVNRDLADSAVHRVSEVAELEFEVTTFKHRGLPLWNAVKLDSERYRSLRAIAMKGNLEAFVAFSQIDFVSGDASQFDATFDEELSKWNLE